MKKRPGLDDGQRAAVLRALSKLDRPLRLLPTRESNPSGAVDAKRIRFGFGTMAVGIFLLAFCAFLPPDARRGWFIAAACLTFFVGVWHVDIPSSTRKNSKRRPR